MQSSINKVLFGTAFFFGSCLVAVIGYTIAGWSILESIYMVTITIFGVGFREVRPIDEPHLRVFTIFVIIAGCTSAIYVMGGFVQMVTEGELNRFLGARRMSRGIDKLNDHVIVCGYGRVGRILTAELAEAALKIVVIDQDKDRLMEAEKSGLFAFVGDATEESTLVAAGAARAKALATVLPNDAANVFITLSARELNPDMEIIARGQSPDTEKKLLRSGASKVVLPAAIGASRIARLITRPSVESLLVGTIHAGVLAEDLEQVGLSISEIPLAADSEFVGCELGEIRFGDATQFVVVAIRRSNGEVVQQPPAECVLEAGDVIVFLAHRGVKMTLAKASRRAEILYRGARG